MHKIYDVKFIDNIYLIIIFDTVELHSENGYEIICNSRRKGKPEVMGGEYFIVREN